ncbi:MAG: helix-turn-helix transcriptional regulator, partial [Romboutsia sp.]|nr:helix-turn-helix transcriptional regulator [Romboutsia sp.]
MNTTTLQRNIKYYLKQQGLTVAELERRAGTKHAVVNIVHGRTINPSAQVTQAIAKQLGCSMEDLLSD